MVELLSRCRVTTKGRQRAVALLPPALVVTSSYRERLVRVQVFTDYRTMTPTSLARLVGWGPIISLRAPASSFPRGSAAGEGSRHCRMRVIESPAARGTVLCAIQPTSATPVTRHS